MAYDEELAFRVRAMLTRFEMRGKPIAGWLRIEAEAVEEDAELRDWVERCAAFVASLPAK